MFNNYAEMKLEVNLQAARMGLRIEANPYGMVNSKFAYVGSSPAQMEIERTVALLPKQFGTPARKYNVVTSDFYMTHAVKRYVSMESRKSGIMPTTLSQWRELLIWELSCLPNLEYVVVSGELALNALMGLKDVHKWRGSVLPLNLNIGRPLKALITLDANELFRKQTFPTIYAMDVAKFGRLIHGKIVPMEINTHINPTFKEAMNWLDYIHHESDQPISIDIETTNKQTACIGTAVNAKEAMCINFRNLTENQFSIEEEIKIRLRFDELGMDDNKFFIAQNGAFDMGWLWYMDKIRIKKVWCDTMLGHHLLYPQLPHNLGFLTTQYTDHPYYKDEKDDWRNGDNIDSFWKYNGKDCCITWRVANKIINELRERGLEDFFFDHIMAIQPHLVLMTVGGVKIDMSLKEQVREQVSTDVQEILRDFHHKVKEATGVEDYEPNPGSPAQMKELYFRKLKLVGRGESSDAKNRERMLQHPRTSPIAKDIIISHGRYAEERKFLGNYAEMLIDPDGRIRCDYKQTGVQAAPGRLSSSSTLWESGANLQNQPSRAYPMFIADEGYGYAYFDSEQAEARLVACFADIEVWKQQFERALLDGAYDAHRALASEMFGIPYDEVPVADIDEHGKKTLRFISKRCRHGLNYRMMADRLAETTGLPYIEASKAYNIYHRTTPELQIWWKNLEEEFIREKRLVNAFGRELPLIGNPSAEALKSIVAFKPQSTLGDHVSATIRLCHEDDDWPADARIILNIHDALIALAPIPKLKTCLRIMMKHAERPIYINDYKLIIPAGLGISEPDEFGIHRWSTINKMKRQEFL